MSANELRIAPQLTHVEGVKRKEILDRADQVQERARGRRGG
jgi:hypothetical protein